MDLLFKSVDLRVKLQTALFESRDVIWKVWVSAVNDDPLALSTGDCMQSAAPDGKSQALLQGVQDVLLQMSVLLVVDHEQYLLLLVLQQLLPVADALESCVKA